MFVAQDALFSPWATCWPPSPGGAHRGPTCPAKSGPRVALDIGAPLSVTPQPPARSTSGSGGWRRGTPTEAAPAPPPGPPTGSHTAPVDPQRVEGDTLLLACWGSSGTSSGAGRTLAAQTTRTHRQADPAVQSKRSCARWRHSPSYPSAST